MKFLVINDNRELIINLNREKQSLNYTLDFAQNLSEAYELIKENLYNLIIIKSDQYDSELEFCVKLRNEGVSTYLMLMSPVNDIEKKLKAYDVGIDEYILEPIDFRELLARVKALLKREIILKESVLKVKDLEVNLLNREVTRDSKVIELTVKEFALLEFFLENKDLVLTRDKIAQKVWSIDFLTDTNIVDVYINHLRKKIDKGYKEKLIHTVRGLGYILKT